MQDKPAFDHGIHWATGVLDCADCHTAVVETKLREADMPSSKVCAGCHEGEDRAAWFPRPTSHGENRLEGHQTVQGLNREDCAVCHRLSSSCTACHHGAMDGYLLAREDWLPAGHAKVTDHAAQACAECHNLAKDCNACHQEQDIQPQNHRQRSWDHRHARYANRAQNCVICHGRKARVCTTCHG